MRIAEMGIAIIACAVLSPARADTIQKRDDTVIEKVKVTQDTEQQVDYARGSVSDKVFASQVRRIDYDAPEEFARARALEEKGELASAAEAYREAAAKADRPLVKQACLYQAGESLYRNGKFPAARDLYEQAAAQVAASRLAGLAGVRQAQCEYMEGKPADARARLEKLGAPAVGIASQKECLRRYWLGRVLAEQNQAQDAKRKFEDAERGAKNQFPEIEQGALTRAHWVAARDPADCIDRLLKIRSDVKDPQAQAEFYALLSREYLKQAEKLTDKAKQEAQAVAAFHALRVVDALRQDPEDLALAYHVVVQALAAVGDPHAAEMEKAAQGTLADWMKTPGVARK